MKRNSNKMQGKHFPILFVLFLKLFTLYYVKILNTCRINKKHTPKTYTSEEIPVSLLTSFNCFFIRESSKAQYLQT